MAAMIDPTILSAVVLAGSLGAGLSALNARELNYRAREQELREAVDLLRVHCEAMEKLDNDDVPVELLEFALELSAKLHDPNERRTTIAAAIQNRDQRVSGKPIEPLSDDDPIPLAYRHLLETRPDLASAFVQCLFAGVLSFERRWPECAGAFGSLSRMVESPVAEARRVVDVARGANPAFADIAVSAMAA